MLKFVVRVLMHRQLVVILLLTLCTTICAEQPQKLPFDVLYDLVQLYIETMDDRLEDKEELKNNLVRAYANPINWNTATHSQLADLLFLSDPTIDELLYYIYVYGPAHSINELRLVPYVDDKLLDILPSLLYVPDTVATPTWTDGFRYTSHRIASRTDVTAEPRAGNENGAFLGPGFRQLVKYQAEASSSFSAALTMETDAGEPWNVRGFDLYRGYAQFSSFLNDSRVVVGTYRATFGAGLVIGGTSYGSLSTRLRNIRSNCNIRGYAGVSGEPALNGVAASISPLKDLTVTALYGYSPIDARLTSGTWTSTIDDELHRTASEQACFNAVQAHTVAAHVQYRHHYFSVGATGYGGFFSAPSTVFGSAQWAASLDYSAYYRFFHFSGETSICQSNALATTNFITIKPLPDLTFILNIRYFSENYQSFWAHSYSRYDRMTGEHGASFSALFPLYINMTMDLFADVSKNTLPTSFLYGSPIDYELKARYSATFANSGNLTASLRFRQRHSLYLPENEHTQSVTCDNSYLIKVQYRCPFSNGFVTNSGMQMSFARDLTTEWSKYKFGWLIYQDLDYTLPKSSLLFRVRMALFDAPLWANRFYLTEANIAESSYSPVLNGEGFRWYFVVKYSAPFGLSAQFRVAQTLYADRESIGSGNDQINSSHKTDFHILIAYKF